jgi:cobalt/nickel transport protein
MSKKSQKASNFLMVLVVILLAVLPLVFVKNAEFGGADGQAEGVIASISPEYTPWFSPLFEPASGEIESLLFALQAAIGAGVIGFGMGYYYRGKSLETKKTA